MEIIKVFIIIKFSIEPKIFCKFKLKKFLEKFPFIISSSRGRIKPMPSVSNIEAIIKKTTNKIDLFL